MSDYLQAQVCVNCGGLVPKRQSSQSVTCMRVPWWRRVLTSFAFRWLHREQRIADAWWES